MTLRASGLQIEIGARVLLADATFELRAGEKVALVGPNGAGKTTLLRTLAGDVAPAAGHVRLPRQVGWLPQDTMVRADGGHQIDAGHLLAFDHLLAASPLASVGRDLTTVHDEMSQAGIDSDADALDGAVTRYGELEERFRLGGGYELESTAERIAAGIGLDEEALLQKVGSLSGGQRRRLELARVLLSEGELLILDEPTNHLDVEAKAFVMEFLRSSPSAVLVVSHDIELMNESIDRVFSLEGGKLDIYRGTYSDFLAKRAEREAALARDATNAQREVARLQRTADKFRQGNATSARKRKNFEQRIERITSEQAKGPAAVKRKALKVRFPEPIRAGDRVLHVDGLQKRFGEQTVLDGVQFTVGRGEVFLVVGPNGAGKTTLLRCLAGIYATDAGTVTFGSNVTLGYYAQEHEDIHPGSTVLEVMQAAASPGVTISELRAIVGHFGLVGDVANQDASTLSGGEKTKLSLARLVAGKANLLLLDEPTNNLDTASRQAVLDALQHFRGTVVLVSHDLEFVAELAPEHAIVLPSGRRLPFDERMLDLVPA
ncbi:MAG TPA: ABC-F family ATP-binding cassette domain-containing protein [Acidimicrobiales bacterium]|jgi:ATPase subunit of ABC transporter with duplicated ATPase domains